jgi:hypothetical protein
MHHRQNPLEPNVKLYSSVHVVKTEKSGSDPQEEQECFSTQMFQTCAGAHPAPCSLNTEGSFRK